MSVKSCESCGRFFNDQGLSDLFGPDFDKYCSPECARKAVGVIDRDVVVGNETQRDSDGISPLPMAGGCIKLMVYAIPFIFFINAVFAFFAFAHLIPLEAHNPFLPYCDFCKEHMPYEKKDVLLYDCSECGRQMVTSSLNLLLGLLCCAPFMFLNYFVYVALKKKG